MVPNLNGPPTIILILGARALNLIFPTNLNEPPSTIVTWTQFKWAPNNNIDPDGPDPLNLIFVNQLKWVPYNNI